MVLDQTRASVLPGQEWNRELNARKPGALQVRIDCANPITVSVVTDATLEAAKAGRPPGKDGVVLSEEVATPPFARLLALPAGKLWVVVRNDGKSAADIRMRWTEPDAGRAPPRPEPQAPGR